MISFGRQRKEKHFHAFFHAHLSKGVQGRVSSLRGHREEPWETLPHSDPDAPSTERKKVNCRRGQKETN